MRHKLGSLGSISYLDHGAPFGINVDVYSRGLGDIYTPLIRRIHDNITLELRSGFRAIGHEHPNDI